MVLSGGAHLLMLGFVPALCGGDISSLEQPYMEFGYLELIGDTRGGVDPDERVAAAADGVDPSALTVSVRKQDGAHVEAVLPEKPMRGTGEIVSAAVKEELKPLVPRGATISDSLLRYKRRLERILEQESLLSYPDASRERGREARVHVRFSLRADGSLESVEVPQGVGEFGRELVAGLEKAAVHFPAFPSEIGCSTLTFSWPVRFDLSIQ